MLWGGLTYSGHPVCCAAAVANLSIYEEERIFENVEEQGRYLESRLHAMKDRYRCVGDVRYKGLFSVIELVKDKTTKEPLAPFAGSSPEMNEACGIPKIEIFVCLQPVQHALGLPASHHFARRVEARSRHH